MPTPQPAIFITETPFHWFLHYRVADAFHEARLRSGIREVRDVAAAQPVNLVVGFGSELLRRLCPAECPQEHRPFTEIRGRAGHTAIATQEDLFFWVHSDRHDLDFDVARAARRALSGIATLARETQSWVYRDSRDLTGFIDGTANPPVEEARTLAVVSDGPGAGGSFVLTQRYVHDLDGFAALSVAEQEAVIGRTKPDSVESDPHPSGSHLSRVVIERDGEELEIFRRSVPYGDSEEAGLYFLAFSDTLDIFDTMLQRMYGATADGEHDRLMDFSRPASGAYYFAPPLEVLDAITG